VPNNQELHLQKSHWENRLVGDSGDVSLTDVDCKDFPPVAQEGSEEMVLSQIQWPGAQV
jgi:hypothetical protein